MNKLKLAILGLAILFLLVTSFLDLPPLLNKILYGFMSVFSILFLFIKRKDLNIDDIFSKDQDKEVTED